MRNALLLTVLLAVLPACQSDGSGSDDDKAALEASIRGYHRTLLEAYQGGDADLAAAFDATFDPEGRFITYWGREEPVDSTRARALGGVGRVMEYNNNVENVEVRVFGDGAVLTCIIRQEYMLMGHAIDEFMPTTYVFEKKNGTWMVIFTHRSADFETIRQQMDLMAGVRAEAETE